MTTNITIKPNEVHLIPLDSGITLFFHATSLQIYPLKDERIIKFLTQFREQGQDTLLNNEDNQEIYDFIVSKINSAPKTIAGTQPDASVTMFNGIVFPIAGECNLGCPYCFAQTEAGFGFDNFTTDDVVSIARFLVKQNKDNKTPIYIVFFGGDPMLKFDIMQFTVKHFAETYPEHKVGYSITTNGTIVNDEILRFLKDNNFSVLISLDGPDNEFNLRKYKDGRSCVKQVVENIKKFTDKGIPVELRATLLNNNTKIVETYDFFENLKVPFYIIFAYASENKGHDYDVYEPETLQGIKMQLDSLFHYYVNKVKNREPIYSKLILLKAKYFRFRIKSELVCGAGIGYFTITADGTIFSCPHLMNDHKYAIGNIKTGVADKQTYIPVNVNEIKECEGCWAKYLCSGGCFAQKISSGGSNKSAMNVNECELKKAKWEFYLKLYHSILEINPDFFKSTDK